MISKRKIMSQMPKGNVIIPDKSWLAWFKDGDFTNHILNEENIPITSEVIEKIFKKYNFSHKVKNLDMFQLAMVHISYKTRTTLTEKTATLLKDVIPIESNKKHLAMPLQNDCYGRLEFLGDAYIHCILAEYLFDRYNVEDEGFLTKLRTKIEKDETLSKLSKILGLHKYAIVARNIEQSNGRLHNTHLTEDILEAFFGALSLETSYEKCKQFFIAIIEKELDIAEMIYTDDNYKDRLMQYFHQQKWPDPKYIEDVTLQKIIKEGCSETRSYTTYVKTQEGKILGTGVGISKSKSEQNAAYDALKFLKVINDNSVDNNSDYYGEDSDDISHKSTEEEPIIISDSESDYFEE